MNEITVVIPAHPPRLTDGLLSRALASVWEQELPPVAVIVEIDHERAGAARTRTAGLAKVTTEWVAFLDSDDTLMPNHLRALMMHAESTGADLIYPWFEIVGGTDPLLVPSNGVMTSPLGVTFGQEQEECLRDNNFIPVTNLVRTELAQAVGGFPQPGSSAWGHSECEDWGFLLALLDAGGRFAHLPQRTWTWYHHGLNTSGRSDRW